MWWRFLRRSVVILLIFPFYKAHPQRSYTPHSVLSTGKWYKIAVSAGGIYKLDLSFLQKLGLSTGNLSSSSIRVYGNGGGMLPENNNSTRKDDLQEVATWAEDGGDGILNGKDYILFYADGPHHWKRDSLQRRYYHQKNLYTEEAYYYITVNSAGKKIQTKNISAVPGINVTTYDDLYFHELDTINFLSSGKNWSGEEFAESPGKTLVRTFKLPFSDVVPGSIARVSTQLNARSFAVPARFNFKIDNLSILQSELAPVATGPYDLFVRTGIHSEEFISPATVSFISIQFTPGSAGSQGWLDWFELEMKRPLRFAGEKQLHFRNSEIVGSGSVARYTIENAFANTQVWDVTEHGNPERINGTIAGGVFSFTDNAPLLKEYVAFSPDSVFTPVAIGAIANQDLHNSSVAELLVVSHPSLLAQAKKLADFHEQRGMRTVTVTTEQVYNEFSSGIPDPSAIRDFVKMYYDRFATDTANRPKYLLLFGDASFDYKSRIVNNTNLVPSYQSTISHDPLSTYTSDDFFGFLDDNEDINSNLVPLLDLGIGRIPARNDKEARVMIEKIISYADPKSFGPWRNEITFVADDEDANLHLQDAEVISKSVQQTARDFNTEKIYLDAFHQESSSGGSRYPAVNAANINKIYQGTLLWNYSGHGGYRRLAEEVILDEREVSVFNNAFKLPLFITATCDFAPFDNPLISSIGEQLLFQEKTGAIALMTTTRIVFAFSNRVMNKNYLEAAFARKADSSYPSLGEAVKNAKNQTYQFFGDIVNNRKFTLLGDPALTLGFPVEKVKTVSINGAAVSGADTLKSLNRYTIAGEITNQSGQRVDQFNGMVYATIFDKPGTETTKGNDPTSIPQQYRVQKSILFKGKARAEAGKFQFSFVVPKDINYQFGKGKISYYAENGVTDANGIFEEIIVGGTGTGSDDQEGPEIKAFLNDEKFITGGLSDSRPVLILKFTDSSGINTMGTGIGHDLVAILDNDPAKKFILNRFYESEPDDFRKGQLRFQLPEMADGFHTIAVKAWDVANNSSEAVLDFRVANESSFQITQVLNYPNPFTTHTGFWFMHNRPGDELKIHIQIYTVTGRLVKTITNTIISMGNRSNDVFWNGRDDYGNKIGRGVYIYQIKVTTSDGQSASKLEKLYIL